MRGEKGHSPTRCKIAVLGAGISGLWQAFTLQSQGHDVTLVEKSAASEPFANAASWYAAGMLAPYCEGETAEARVAELGLQSLPIWRKTLSFVQQKGSIALALPRDRSEFERFAGRTTGHRLLNAQAVAALEPDLGERYSRALFFPDEAHVPPRRALGALLDAFRAAGGQTRFAGDTFEDADFTIDCRGYAARDKLSDLRGVRGEMVVIQTDQIALSRPIRLLHPRFPLYVVPWGKGQYMIGSTVIESEDRSRVTARSALDILAAAYALHPAFGEAEVIELGAGIRPAFPSNVPGIVRSGSVFYVNGMYRHGFLTAPALAGEVARMIARACENDPADGKNV